MQDRLVFFGSGYGFRGRPIWQHHLNLPPDDPCCHGDETWDKIGYNSAYVRDIPKTFVYNRGFWCCAVEWCQTNSTTTNPCCRGNEIWDKIGYNSACHGLCGSYKLLYKRWALSMGKGKFRPRTAPTFIDRSSWNSSLRNTSGRPPHMTNFFTIGLRGWAGRTPVFHSFGSFFVFLFVYSSHGVLAIPLDQLRRTMAHRTCFRQGSAFWGSRWWNLMFGGQNHQKRKFWRPE